MRQSRKGGLRINLICLLAEYLQTRADFSYLTAEIESAS